MQPTPLYVPAGPPGVDYPTGPEQPAAVLYFRLYCGFMAFVYVLVLGLGIFLMMLPSLIPSSGSSPPDQHEALIVGGLYATIGAVLTVPYGIGAFVGRRPWVHTFGIVMVGLTMTSCACIPVALPLLLAWLKPPVKAWYRDTV